MPMNHQMTQRSKHWAVFGMLLVLFLVSLDQTVVGTAMPRVIADMRGFELYAWITTIYLLTQTSVIPIVGKLGDMYGRKWILITGVVIFLLGSWLCGFAPSMWWLIAARGIQGIGGGTIFATVFTLIADVFPDPTERARYQGLFFAVFSISSVIGPLIGGFITDTLGWRWVFYVNVPLGVASLATLPFVLPQTAKRGHGKIDWLGAVVITIGVVALLLAFTWLGEGVAWTDPRVLGGFIITLVALALFIPIEQRAAEPIIPFSIFRHRAISAATVLMFVSMVAMFGVILYTPLFLQGVLGQTASASGVVLIPMVLLMAVASIGGGQLIARFGHVRPFLIFGAAMLLTGSLLLMLVGTTTSPLLIAGMMFLFGVALGLLLPNTTLVVQTVVEPRNIGVATSSTQFIRSIGATVGAGLMGFIVATGYTSALLEHMPAGVGADLASHIKNPDALVSPQMLDALRQAASAVPNSEVVIQAMLDAARSALAVGVHDGYLIVLGASVVAVLAALMIPPLNLKLHAESRARLVEEEGGLAIPTA
jgi:EmrB/QacA subfamily drug resistance transporter